MANAPGQIELKQEVPVSTPGDQTPSAGSGNLILFPDGGSWYSKDGAGVVALITGAPSSRQIISGAGLVGGGSLAADRTLDIVAADGTIVVGADSIAVGVIGAANIAEGIIDNADLVNQVQATVKGRAAGAGTGVTQDLSQVQLTALVNPATLVLPGAMAAADKKKIGMFYDAEADFGFVGDHVKVFDGAINSGSPNLACATSTPFTSTAVDGGKRITVAGAGTNGAVLVTTILTVTDSGHAVLAANAATTVAAKGTQFGTDNTAAITAMQNAVNNAVWPSVVVRFGQSALQQANNFTNDYGCPTQFTFNKAVELIGIGSSANHDIGDYAKGGGTCLSWWGTSSDGGTAFKAFITFIPTVGTTAQAISCPQIKDLWIDCRNGDQNQALVAIDAQSVNGFSFDNVYVMDSLAIAYYFRVVGPGLAVPNAGSLGEAKDSTRGTLSNLRARMLDNPATGTAALIGSTTTSAVTLSTTPQSINIAGGPTLPNSGYAWVKCNLGYFVLINYTGVTGTPVGGTLTSSSVTALTGVTCSAQDAINAPATVSGSNVIQAVPGNGSCAVLDGDTGANACCSTGSMWVFLNGISVANVAQPGPATISFRNSDSWELFNPMVNHPAATTTGPGILEPTNPAINRIRKPGVEFCGSNTASTLAARNNHIYGGSPGAGGVEAYGLTPVGLLVAPSGPNYWDGQQLGNGEALPNVENAAVFHSSQNGALPRGGAGIPLVAPQTITTALLQITGSVLWLPTNGLQIGTEILWDMGLTQVVTAVVNTLTVRLGPLGTSADTAIATFGPTGTVQAVASPCRWVVKLVVLTLGAAATFKALMYVTNSTATGFNGGAAWCSTLAPTATATFNVPTTGFTGPEALSLALIGGTGASFVISQSDVQVVHPGPR